MLLHVGGLVLGPAGDAPRGRRAAVERLFRDVPSRPPSCCSAFWLPAPLLDLIRGAARVVAGG